MQLTKTKSNWRTVTIMAGVVMGGSIAMYASVDPYSNITTVLNNHDTAKYISDVNNEADEQLDMHFLFNNLVAQWKENTMFCSSAKNIIEDKNFQAIVALGKKAVPYIVNEINLCPSTLVWALNIIYNKKITDRPNVTVSDACRLWVKKLTE